MTYFAHFRHYPNGQPENKQDFSGSNIVATIAAIRTGENQFNLGFAFVNPEDQPSKKIGRQIAEGRAANAGSGRHSHVVTANSDAELTEAIADIVTRQIGTGILRDPQYGVTLTIGEVTEKSAVIANDVFNKNHASV